MSGNQKQRKNNLDDNYLNYYQTNFFLDFKNAALSNKFIEQYFKNQHFFIEILLVFLIFIMVLANFLRNCLEPDSETVFRCTHKYLYILSFFSLIFTFFLIKKSLKMSKNLVFLRVCLIFGTFYINIWTISMDIIPETIWMVMIVLISMSNFVIFVTWRHHICFSFLNISMIYLYLYYFDPFLYKSFIVNNVILMKILLFSILLAALKEKMYKELWILIETSRKSEKNLEKFIEDLTIPVMVLDANKNIILINRYCTVLFDSLENSTRKKENIKSYLHRSMEDFFNENDLEFLDMVINGALNKQAVFSRIFVVEEIERKKDDEQKRMRNIISDLSEYVEESYFVVNSLYEISASSVRKYYIIFIFSSKIFFFFFF